MSPERRAQINQNIADLAMAIRVCREEGLDAVHRIALEEALDSELDKLLPVSRRPFHEKGRCNVKYIADGTEHFADRVEIRTVADAYRWMRALGWNVRTAANYAREGSLAVYGPGGRSIPWQVACYRFHGRAALPR